MQILSVQMSWLRTASVITLQIVQYTSASISRRYVKPGTCSIDILESRDIDGAVEYYDYKSNRSIITDFKLSEFQNHYLDSIERLCFSKAFVLMLFRFA